MLLGKILMAFASEWERFENRVVQLINESIPGLAYELIPEWETDLGLPDACSKLAITLEERSAIAHAKYTGKYSGQSKSFYIGYAASLGFMITVTDSPGGTPFRVDKNRVDRTPTGGIDGARLGSVGVLHKWLVTVLSSSSVDVRYLQCRFEQLKPAHTEIIWSI